MLVVLVLRWTRLVTLYLSENNGWGGGYHAILYGDVMNQGPL